MQLRQGVVQEIKKLRVEVMLSRQQPFAVHSYLEQLGDHLSLAMRLDGTMLISIHNEDDFQIFKESSSPVSLSAEDFSNQVRLVNLKATSGKAVDLTEHRDTFHAIFKNFASCEKLFCYKIDVDRNKKDASLVYVFSFRENNSTSILFSE